MHYLLDGDTVTGRVSTQPEEALIAVLPIFGDGSKAVWRWGSPKAKQQADELVCRRVSGRLGVRFDVFQKDYNDAGRTKKLRTIWLTGEIGSTDGAKRELAALFPNISVFATPKPERLIHRIVEAATDTGDLVLDCFAGSGTTAAVAHKMGRRWVTVEKESSTVEAFTQPRLEKVIMGDDPGGVTGLVGWGEGGGFRVLTVGPSMYDVLDERTLLTEWATNGTFAKAVCAQLGFAHEDDPPFSGVKGRTRLAVIDGVADGEVIRGVVSRLGGDERAVVVAKAATSEAASLLRELSPGSRFRKAPRDLLKRKVVR